MTLVENLERIKRIDDLIRKRATGSPKELAHKLHIAESTLYFTLKIMKELGAQIEYSKYSLLEFNDTHS